MKSKTVVSIVLLVAFFYCVNFQVTVIPVGTWVPLESVSFEETPDLPFIPAVTSATDFVDARQSLTYGSTVTDPPSGMGNADAASTDLVEGSYVVTSYTTLEGPHDMATFPPTGWSATAWAQQSTGGNPTYYALSTAASGAHYLTSGTVNLAGYTGVRFSWDWKRAGSEAIEAGDLDIETNTGAWLQQWTNTGDTTTWTNVVDTQVTSYASWQMRFYFYAGSTAERVGLDNVKIEGYTDSTYYRFEAVFRFDSIEYSPYYVEKLYVDFDAASSAETLTWYGGTSSSPTTVIKSAGAGNADFNVDISATLTGTPYYVRIVDDLRDGDTDQDTWNVDQCYIYLENQAPVNDGTPTCNSLYDTSYLYAHKSPNPDNFAYITTYHADPDGYADIMYCYVEGYMGSQYWQARYTRSSDSYAITVGSTVIAIENGTETPSGTDLDIVWHIKIDWDHADIPGMDLKVYTYDLTGRSASTVYYVNWDVETKTEANGAPVLSQSARCDAGASLTVSGDWQYYGSASHVPPDPAETDVYVAVSGASTGPWTGNVDSNGEYSIGVTAGATYETNVFYVYVREQGSTTTTNPSPGQDSVVVDKVVIDAHGVLDGFVNAGVDDAVIYATLKYYTDSEAITSVSSFSISDYGTPRSFTYDAGDGRWEATIPANAVGTYVFSDWSINTNEGVSVFNYEWTETVHWCQIQVSTTIADVEYANYGGTAQIRVTATLIGYSHALGAGDTLYINDGISDYLMVWDAGNAWFEKDFTKSSIGLFTFTVSTSNANEATYGITTVDVNGKSDSVTWDRVRVVSYAVITPSGAMRVGLGTSVLIEVEVHFDSDESDVVSGTLTANGIVATYTGANGKWRFTDSKGSMQAVLYNNMQSSGNARGLTVEDNSVTHTEIWDRALLAITANCSWTIVDYYISLSATGIYDYDDSAWTGSVTWTAPHYTSSSVTSVSYGAERVVSITSNEYPYVTAYSVVSSDSVVFDEMGLSSVAYWWVQYTDSQVWLVFEVGSIYWQYNSSDVNNSPQTKVQSYVNGTADDWARAYDGTIGSMLIGSFNPQWWFANVTLNAEITVSGAFYNWTVWCNVLRVDILHSIHIDDSVIYLTDQYITLGVGTNWGNACIPVFDQLIDNITPIFYSPSEGWFQIPISDVPGVHNLTILINGSHSGASWVGNTQDWSIDTERYSWVWRQFVYVVNPVVTTYETKIVILDTLGTVLDFSTFQVFRNGTHLYWPECITYSTYSYNVTVKDRWGEVLNSTVLPAGDYEFVIIVQVHTLKVMSWHHDFVYLNLTHGGLTYREVIAPMETVQLRLFTGSYSFAVDYRNGSIISGNLNIVDSTALIVTGSTIADLAGYSSTLLAMTTNINVTVTSTSNQVLTISIDLTNVNSTIHTQLIQLLLNVTNTNSTLYSQTVDLLAAIQNANSTLFTQTVSILASLQNVNATLYSQTLTLLADVQNMNSTLYSQTLTVLTEIQNANMTLYNQTVSILTYILNTNSTLFAQTVTLLAEVDTVEEQALIIEGVARKTLADLPEDPPSIPKVTEDIWSLVLKVLAGFVIILIFGIVLATVIRALLNDRRLKAPGGNEQNATNNPVIYSE